MDEKNMNEELDILDILLDEENEDDIVLYDENGDETKFEQVAIIPLNKENGQTLYCILKPVDKIEGVADDEAIVFEIIYDEEGNEPSTLSIVLDEKIIDEVFGIYEQLLNE